MRAFLRRHRRVALDTSIFIYELEANPRYVTFADLIFAWVEQSGHSAITSTITMTELLVQPYRDTDDDRVDQIYGLLSTYPNLEWIPPDLEIADIAARLRALHRMRTPDALHAATAVRSQATGFLTNDPIFMRVNAFETLHLDERSLVPHPRQRRYHDRLTLNQSGGTQPVAKNRTIVRKFRRKTFGIIDGSAHNQRF